MHSPRQFGLIGRSISYSFSPTYFQHKFETLGLVDHSYELFELNGIHELPALLDRRPHLVGLNVTIPYKEEVWPYVDELAPSAARVGAINVLQIQHDGLRRRLIGHNTDVLGFLETLRHFYPHRGRALVLGTGGAAKSVEMGLRELGIEYWLVTRQPTAMRALTYADLTPAVIQAHPLIINATPVGTSPHIDECPALPYEALTPEHYLFDLVYNPSETKFLRLGREAGAHTRNGFEMLTRQAEGAWQIWQANL